MHDNFFLYKKLLPGKLGQQFFYGKIRTGKMPVLRKKIQALIFY